MADADALLLALDTLAELVAARVVAKLQAGTMPGYVDQASSPLGRRRHIDAVRSGTLPGIQLGRRYLARVEDIERYIAESGAKGNAHGAGRSQSDKATDPVDRLAAELGFPTATRGKKPR